VPEPVSPVQVDVRRSTRRQRTVSAYRDGDTVVVLLPARMTKADERHWVAEMLRRLERSEARRRTPRSSDDDLMRRATELSAQYLQARAVPTSVRWVPPMRTRWGSATPADRTIRLSERLRETPAWVIDYVLVHELAHLIEPGHTPRFWELVGRYPRTERAIGFLHGLSAAANLGITGTDGDED
jgi:predicted metal-dependent hydrolase